MTSIAVASLTLLVTSSRVPAGVLSRDAWTALTDATKVFVVELDDPVPAAILASGIQVTESTYRRSEEMARELVRVAAEYLVVWIGSLDDDLGLTDALAGELTRLEEPPSVEVLTGS